MKNIMKRKNVFWATLACIAMAGLMASCNKEDANGTNVSDYPTLIVGKWKCVSLNIERTGETLSPIDSGLTMIAEYTADGWYFASETYAHNPLANEKDTARYWIEGDIIKCVWQSRDYVDTASAIVTHLDWTTMRLKENYDDSYGDNYVTYEFNRMANK